MALDEKQYPIGQIHTPDECLAILTIRPFQGYSRRRKKMTFLHFRTFSTYKLHCLFLVLYVKVALLDFHHNDRFHSARDVYMGALKNQN